MNLLMISLHADPTVPAGIGEGGGTHSYIRELLTYYSNVNINVLLITRKCSPDLPEYEQISETCKIYRIIVNGEYPIDKKELFKLHNISVNKTINVLKTTVFKPTLIHSIYWNSGQVAAELSQFFKIPFVHTVISNGLRRKEAGMKEAIEERFSVEKNVFQNASYIFCITPAEKKDLIELYQIDPNKTVIPGRPVSPDFLYPAHDDFGNPYLFKLNKKDISSKSQIRLTTNFLPNITADSTWWNKKAFIYCGRIASNKGVDIIIKAWIKLKEKYADNCPSLWIVGGALNEIESFKADKKIEFHLEKYEARGEIIWWGYLDQRGISTLFLKALALIMHSSYEPGGRVIIEALASGIPVIATPNGFGADYVYNWFDGFQIPYGDSNSMYSRMLLFLKQPYLSNNLGINAKRYMKQILNEWNFTQLHYDVYQSAIANNNIVLSDTEARHPYVKYINYINVYPFFNDIIANKDLKPLLEKYFNEPVFLKLSEFQEDQALWLAKTSDSQYDICQPYTKLLEICYYNPFFHKYVDTRADIYLREKYALNAAGINPIVILFDNYYIYTKRQFPNLNFECLSKSNASELMQNLFFEFESNNNSSDINALMQQFVKDWKSSNTEEIEDALSSYYEILPTVLYHCNSFCLGLSFRQLYYMITDETNFISDEIENLYYKCINFINQILDNNVPSFSLCIEDCSIKNIVYDKFHSVFLFKDAKSIYWGDNSRMPARFIYSYLLSSDQHIHTIETILAQFAGNHNKKLCLGWLFEIAFEQVIFYTSTKKEKEYIKAHHILNRLVVEFID